MEPLLIINILITFTQFQRGLTELARNNHPKSVEAIPFDVKTIPLCSDKRCQCRKWDGREDVGSSSDESTRGSQSRSYISATCTTDAIDDAFGHLLAKSTSVRNLILVPSLNEDGTSKKWTGQQNLSVPAKPLTLPWKATVRKPSLGSLDLASVQLGCDCRNAWLAFWPDSLSEPLVSAEILRFLANRRRRRSVNTKPGYRYLHVINEEPSCPYNCSLTVAELFHMPKRILLNSDENEAPILDLFNDSFADHKGPFAHCLPQGEPDARAYFARKCDLIRLAFDVDRVIQNETESTSIICSRLPIMEMNRITNTSLSTCPHLKLAPFINIDDANSTVSTGRKRQRWPLVTRCLSKDVTVGEKVMASRNESGWLLCQEQNPFLPQAALAPFIVAGSPQIMHFFVDHLPEQVHITFYVVGYPRPQFGWHNRNALDNKWLKPNSTKGFEVILSSKPSFGHFIISGRATFAELSMNCFKGAYDFQVCNSYGCDRRGFDILIGMPEIMCPLGPAPTIQPDSGNSSGHDSHNQSVHISLVKSSLTLLALTTLPSYIGKEQENWIYIAVPFLVVFAVVLVGVLTTCLFLRLIGGGGVGSNQSSTRKSSLRYKTRPSLTDWELSPLNQQLPSLEVNSSYVDWLHNIKTHVRVFPAGEVAIIKELGEGAFGRVFLARVTLTPEQVIQVNSKGLKQAALAQYKARQSSGSFTPSSAPYSNVNSGEELYYAVKLLKNVTPEKLEDLEREAAIMSQLDHPNIVQFFGLSCKSGSLALLFEYMEHGDLVNYLRNHSPDTEGCQLPLQPNDLLIIAVQIAKGLEYLAERHLVHRDLAARNCLVGKDMTVKISDFGMTRDIYITDYYKMGSRTLVPLRWLPPESILYRKFTVESDIWSFGVLLWEIFSYGKIPWYMHSNCEVLQIIQDGKLLEQPGSPEEVYDYVMLKCWARSPSERISANAARRKLEELMEARLRYCNVLPSYSDLALSATEISQV